MLAGAALNELRAMACVRAHRHRRVELGFGSHHCLGFRSPSRRPVSVGCNLCYRIERWVMFGEGGMHATQQCRKVVFYNNNNAEFWNWVSPRHEKARAAGRMSIGLEKSIDRVSNSVPPSKKRKHGRFHYTMIHCMSTRDATL